MANRDGTAEDVTHGAPDGVTDGLTGDGSVGLTGGTGDGSVGLTGGTGDGTGGARSWGDLADRFGDLARTLQAEEAVADTLAAIVQAAVGTIPGAAHASISSVIGRRAMITRASTDDVGRGVDRAQDESGEGPCLDTLYEQRTVRVPDMARETRWPGFVARVQELGVGSMLSVQLYVEEDDLGALNLSSEQADAFGDESEHVALLFAAHAAVAMSGAQAKEALRRGLGTRDLIGQAKGILMERYRVTGDEAFQLLVRASQTTNRKLHDVADELVTTGRLAERRPDGAGRGATRA